MSDKESRRAFWRRIFLGKSGWQSVYPLWDSDQHLVGYYPQSTTAICPCDPKIDWKYRIISHNAFDNRETWEEEGIIKT